MTIDYAALESFTLGPFRVEPAAGLVVLGDDERQIQPKVMQLLLCLVENHGQIVSREYLLEKVWPGVFVDGGALRRGIYFLRKSLTLDDDNKAIETLSKRGYRLNLTPDDAPAAAETEASPVMEQKAAPVLDSAYRGLQVFNQEHEAQFFGRSALTNQACEAMERQIDDGRAFLLLLGASGSGKSSLARAGVIPELLKRAQARDESPDVLIFQAGQGAQDFLQQLAAKVLAVFSDTRPLEQDVYRFMDALTSDVDETISQLVFQDVAADAAPTCKAIVLFDQFEQLLATGTHEEESSELIFSVIYSLARSGAVHVIATMRNEFYPQVITQETLRFLKGNHGIVDVTQPGAAEIADIVRRPAALAGLAFEQRADRHRLDVVLIDEATTHANSLPLLQFALRELELGCAGTGLLTFDQYEKLGNLEGCLSRHAERVFRELPAETQAVLPQVLSLMVTADPRNASRLLKKSMPLTVLENMPNARQLIEKFIDARLMISFLDPHTDEPSVEIVHESVLAYWERAREWAESSYADLRFRSWMNELSDKWTHDQESEAYLLRDGKLLVDAERLLERDGFFDAEQQRFVQASLSRSNRAGQVRRGVVAVLIGLLGASLFMWNQARNSAERAEEAMERSNGTSAFLASIFEDANPGSLGRDLSARELLYVARDRLKREPLEDPLVHADSLRALGVVLLKLNDYEEAEDMFDEAQVELETIRQKDPRLASQILLEQAGLNRETNNFEKARQFALEALEAAELSGDDFLIAQCQNMLGLIAQGTKEYDLAGGYFDQSMSWLKSIENPREDDTRLLSRVMNNQGLNHMLVSDYEKSEQAFDESVALLLDQGLGESRDYTLTLGNLATLRRFQRRPEESVKLYEEALETSLKFHSENHPDVISQLTNLASAHLSLGSYADVLNTTKRALSLELTHGAYGLTAIPQLRMRRIVAQQLGGVPSSESDISEAEDAAVILAQEYGDTHYTVTETHMAVNAARWERGGLLGADLVKQCEDTRRLLDQQTETPSANPRIVTFAEKLEGYFFNCQ